LRGETIFPVPSGVEPPEINDAVDSTRTYSWKAHVCDMADINQTAHKKLKLLKIFGSGVDAENPPTMKFEHGKLDVFGGINRLSGTYALVGDSVIMGLMAP
jgi:heat shock protein HslJ